MNLRTLKDTPPWDWPEGTGKTLLDILRDDRPSESDLLLATELAGDFTVINDELVDALLSILRSGDRPEEVRGRAAISLGPVLEHADTEAFEDADDLPIAERTFHRIQESLRKLYMDASVPTDVRRRILEASVRASAGLAPGCDPRRLRERRRRLEAHRCLLHALRSRIRCADSRSARQREPRYPLRGGHCGWQLGSRTQPGRTSPPSSPQGRPRSPCCWPRSTPSPASVRTTRPELLADLADSDDEDIADAVHEALAMAEGPSGEDENDERDDDDDARR